MYLLVGPMLFSRWLGRGYRLYTQWLWRVLVCCLLVVF